MTALDAAYDIYQNQIAGGITLDESQIIALLQATATLAIAEGQHVANLIAWRDGIKGSVEHNKIIASIPNYLKEDFGDVSEKIRDELGLAPLAEVDAPSLSDTLDLARDIRDLQRTARDRSSRSTQVKPCECE